MKIVWIGTSHTDGHLNSKEYTNQKQYWQKTITGICETNLDISCENLSLPGLGIKHYIERTYASFDLKPDCIFYELPDPIRLSIPILYRSNKRVKPEYVSHWRNKNGLLSTDDIHDLYHYIVHPGLKNQSAPRDFFNKWSNSVDCRVKKSTQLRPEDGLNEYAQQLLKDKESLARFSSITKITNFKEELQLTLDLLSSLITLCLSFNIKVYWYGWSYKRCNDLIKIINEGHEARRDILMKYNILLSVESWLFSEYNIYNKNKCYHDGYHLKQMYLQKIADDYFTPWIKENLL